MNAAARVEIAGVPAGMVPLSEIARRMGRNAKHLTRRCPGWAAQGLAEKLADGRWLVHESVVPKPLSYESNEARDLRQLAEFKREGRTESDIALAIARRDVLQGSASFAPAARDEERAMKEYINSLAAARKIGPGCLIKKLKPRTLRQWRADYNAAGDAGGLRALLRTRPADRAMGTIGPEAWHEFCRIKHSGNGIPLAEAYRQVLGIIMQGCLESDPNWAWPLPTNGRTPRSVELYYKARFNKAERVWINEGPHKCRGKCLPKVQRNYENVAAGDVLCGDARILDFMVQVAGDHGPRAIRPKLTTWIDTRSRRIVGWYIGERANSDTILSSFKMACAKMATVPREAIIDNGEDYKCVGGPRYSNRKWNGLDSKHIQTAFERLEILVHYAKVRHPWSKIIESHFRSLKTGFDAFVASYVGGQPSEWPFDAAKWNAVNVRSLMTIEGLREQFSNFVKAEDERVRRGDGIDGLCPRQAFEQFFTCEPRRVPDEQALTLLCCRLRGPVGVTRDGVRVDKLQYGKWQEEVWRLQGRQVYVAVDSVELGHVTLCEKDGTPIVVARLDENSGATRQDLRDAESFKARLERKLRDLNCNRDYMTMTPMAQIQERRRLAHVAMQVPDSDLPPPPAAESIKLVRPEIAVAIERMNKAAGAEGIKRLKEINGAAEAVNRQRCPSFRDMPDVEIPQSAAPEFTATFADLAEKCDE